MTTEACQAKPAECVCGPQPGYGFKVSANRDRVFKDTEFTLTVTAYKAAAVGQVDSYGTSPNWVKLKDASAFPSAGTGWLRLNGSEQKFSWTGKDGGDPNKLTGVTPAVTPATGTRVEALREVDTSCSCNARISATTPGGSLTLYDAWISTGDWSAGVATVSEKVTTNPNTEDCDMCLEVREEGAPSRGRRGATTVLLETRDGYKVDIPVAVTSGETFTMTVLALTEDGEIDEDYDGSHPIAISANGTGVLDVTAFSSSWVDGVCTITTQKYTTGLSQEQIKISVREVSGTKRGWAYTSIGLTPVSGTGGTMVRDSNDDVATFTQIAWDTLAVGPDPWGPGNTYYSDLEDTFVASRSMSFLPDSSPKRRLMCRKAVFTFDVSSYLGQVREALLKISLTATRKKRWTPAGKSETTEENVDHWLQIYLYDYGSGGWASEDDYMMADTGLLVDTLSSRKMCPEFSGVTQRTSAVPVAPELVNSAPEGRFTLTFSVLQGDTTSDYPEGDEGEDQEQLRDDELSCTLYLKCS